MNLTMQRIKQGGWASEYDPVTKSLPDTICLIVDTELNWGGKVIDLETKIIIETIVFGDKDRTIIEGTKEELDAMRAVFAVYQKGKMQGVVSYILELMGLPYDRNYIYNFDETCLIYNMWLEEGVSTPTLIDLVTKKPKPTPKPVTQEDIDEVIDIKKNLDLKPGDGVNLILASHLLNNR